MSICEPDCETSSPDLVELPNRNHRSACYFVDQAAQLRREATDPDTWQISTEANTTNREPLEPILETTNLRKWYHQSQLLLDSLRGNEPNYVRAVDGVSAEVILFIAAFAELNHYLDY